MIVDDELEIPAFLRRNPAKSGTETAPWPTKTLDLGGLAKPEDPSVAAFKAKQAEEKRIRTQNRIAKMLLKKEDHTGQRWDARRCKWVPA